MKTLYIIRHAKSALKWTWMEDFDRPLSVRWKDDTAMIWKFLRDKKEIPDIVISSPAKRSKKTIIKICKKIKFDLDEIIYEKWIYEHHMEWIDYFLDYLMDLEDKNDKVYIVWHNMAWSELLNYFVWMDAWDFPTCAVAKVNFDIKSWKKLWKWEWKLDFFQYPKNLKY